MSVLFVSIAFPPKFDSEGLQVAKYFKYLSKECNENNLPIDVVTSAIPTLFMPEDGSLKAADTGYRQKIEIVIRENKYRNFVFRKIAPQLIDRPDSKFNFFQQWKKVVSELKEKPSAIYSRSFPTSSAVMAMKLKEFYKVPWVMHLSDPWVDDPTNKLYGKALEINKELENKCFEAADKICLTSDQTIDFYAAKYPQYKNKFEFFPNVYDHVDIPEKSANPVNQKLRAVYTGGMAGVRSPEPLLKAILQLPEDARSKLEVIFSGFADRNNTAIFDKYKDNCIRFIGSKGTYKEAIQLQQTADVLLLIDFPIKEKKLRMFFLSKLLDYMIAGRYIVATSGEGSACRQIIDGKLGKCFAEDETEQLKNHFLFLLDKFEKEPTFFQIKGIDPIYDAKYNAKRLFHLFNEFI